MSTNKPIRQAQGRPSTMEELLASLEKKQIQLQIDQEISGVVMAKSDKEIVLDLEGKADGVLPAKGLSADQFDKIKVGDSLKAFVVYQENEHGQVVLSLVKGVREQRLGRVTGPRSIAWNKLIQVKNQGSKVNGTVLEINKGGLLVEVDGIRGFLPGSQMSAYKIGSIIAKEPDITGHTFSLSIIEVDQNNNKLIFSQKDPSGALGTSPLERFKPTTKVSGKALGVYPFGLILELGEAIYGMVFPQDMAWERVEDPFTLFKVGDTLEGSVISVDESLGRVNISLKALSRDPFAEIAEKFQTDDVVSGIVTSISDQGISFELKDKVAGFMPSNKQEPGTTYEVGQKLSLLVDSVDSRNRRINVVPMVTSTKGLIYK